MQAKAGWTLTAVELVEHRVPDVGGGVCGEVEVGEAVDQRDCEFLVRLEHQDERFDDHILRPVVNHLG